MNTILGHSLTRREAMKAGLRAGAYAAPVVLSTSILATGVAAVTPPPLITFGQDAVLTNAGANVTFDVYYTLSTQPAGTLTLLGSIVTDRFGFGGGVFPLTIGPGAIPSIKLTYILHGNAATSPAAATFTSSLAGALSGAPTFLGLVVQEPTVAACQVGPLNQFLEYIDVTIIKGLPGTAYDFYVQPNTLAAPVKVTTASTNANGNVTVFAPTPAPITTASTPTSVVVSAVVAGGSPMNPAFTLTASVGTLTTISCVSLQSVGGSIHPLGIGRP